MKLTRSKLEALVEELVDRTMEPCRIALSDASLAVGDLDEVILVGGQTRMPLVQKKVQEIFGREPRKDVNPDEAIAMGAAIQAGVLSGDVKDVLLLDVTPLSLGIETLGGVMSVLIDKNTTIPARKEQVFSTAEDNQSAVTIQVLQGERKEARYNKLLGRFDLQDIPAAPRGVPQIEVRFDIDANGILNVSAKDLATNKEQSIVITASSGLSPEDIEKMVHDAETHSAEDERFQELVTLRNQADALAHSTRKSLEEFGDKATETEKADIQKAVEELEEATKTDDKDAIQEKLENLTKVSAPVIQRMYQEASANQQQPEGDGTTDSTADSGASDDTLDPDFEEVKDDDKK